MMIYLLDVEQSTDTMSRKTVPGNGPLSSVDLAVRKSSSVKTVISNFLHRQHPREI